MKIAGHEFMRAELARQTPAFDESLLKDYKAAMGKKTLTITFKVRGTKNGPEYQWVGSDGLNYSKPFKDRKAALAVADWNGKGLKRRLSE